MMKAPLHWQLCPWREANSVTPSIQPTVSSILREGAARIGCRLGGLRARFLREGVLHGATKLGSSCNGRPVKLLSYQY